jgi:hypothetical protein
MKEFKLRASKAGDLMTNSRGKDAGMGETAKNYLKEWVVEQLTGKQKQIQSKYLEKGIAVEDKALERASKHFNFELKKNVEQLSNNFFTGEFDSKTNDTVIDVKSSWDAFTFPYFMSDPPQGYYLQLQVYMALTGLKKASLVYCLENAAIDEIERLSWSKAKKQGLEEPEIKHWEEAEQELTFDDLPDNMRIKVFNFEYDEQLIKQMEERVIKARNYIENELLTFFK